MTMGGRRLLSPRERSLLGEVSLDEGFEDSEREEMGLACRPPRESPGGRGNGRKRQCV